MSLKIALTGGIGTGKSTVARVFERCGAAMFRADDIAKELMRDHAPLKDALKKKFGDQTYDAKGALNRAWLASQVFTNPEKLGELNALVHPFVQWKLDEAIAACTAPVFVMEAALVYEAAIEDKFDYVVVVDAEDQLRLTRTMEREKSNEDEFHRRNQSQIPQQDKVDAADFVLTNNGTIAQLETAAEQLFSILSILPPRDDVERA
jgi:dephospho-CoA kinase